MLSTQQLDQIRTRAQQSAFAAAMQRLHADVSWTFERPLYLPERPAGYYHEFFCPDHAVQLEYDPLAPIGIAARLTGRGSPVIRMTRRGTGPSTTI